MKVPLVAVLLASTAAFSAPNSGSDACEPPPAGLVSWWPANGNANDVVGKNQGELVGGVGFIKGEVDQAFHFDGTNFVVVPHDPSLNPTESFSVECWVFPDKDPTAWACLVGKWGDSAELSTQRSYAIGLQPGRAANFSISDAAEQEDLSVHSFDTPTNVITLQAWNHLVAVYEQPAGARRIYINGVRVAERIDAPFTVFNGVAPMSFGARYRCSRYVDSHFNGGLDEVSFYNRALSDVEVRALCRAGRAGKCLKPLAPALTAQPASQSVNIGSSARFSVAAAGSWPLSYQWHFNGAPLSGQTTSALSLTDVQPAQGGTYTVLVTNSLGSVRSSNALLTVCLPTVRVEASGARGNRTR